MGLDLHCDILSLHCGYSYIHMVRKILIRMTIDYLKNISFRNKFEPVSSMKDYFIPSPHDDSQDKEIDYSEQEEDFERHRNRLIETFQKSLNGSQLICIDYSIWKNYTTLDLGYYMNEFGIIGLEHFVNHSDCEGYLSVGQSIDIMNLFSRIFHYRDKYVSNDDLKGDDVFFDELVEMVKTSIDKKKFIIFG